MRSYIQLGPVGIRLSRKHLAPWGFPMIRMGGLQLFTRDTGGHMMVASYHPRGCPTWHWGVTVYRSPGTPSHQSERRQGQWHDYYAMPFGWVIRVGRQDYHLKPSH